MLKETFYYRDLIYMLTFRDIKVRYKQAAMGFIWAILMPMVAVLAGVLVKKAISVVSGKPMDVTGIVSIAVKVLPWTFFVSAVKFSVQSLVGNANLVTKIYFPREVLPISAVLACFFDFLIATATLTVFLIVIKIGVSINILWAPMLILFLLLFTTGVGLILSCANLFYRDIKYLVEIILMFGIFFTPVFFSAQMFGKYETLLLLNPIGSILESLNTSIVLHSMPDPFWFAYAGFTSAIVFIFGFAIFHKTEPYFAENI